MRKALRIITVILVACVMATPLLSGITALAADLSGTLDFITSVELTDREGNPLGTDISKSSDLKLTYSYAIPNDAGVAEGDTFTLTIPEQILISVPGSFDLTDNDTGQVIGTGTIAINGTLTIVFTEFVEIYSNIHGSFWFDLAFDEDAIGYDDPAIIVFEVGAATDPYTIEIDFDQPAPPEASIEKDGTYDSAAGEITWRITINPENLEVADAQVVDDIAEGQTFVPASVMINGGAADLADYEYDSGVLTYNFPSTISSEQVLTFKVTVDDTEFIFPDSHGETVTEGNTATFNHDGTTVVSNEATVDVPVNFIDKTGSYDSADKQIDWTITVNQNGVTIPNAVLEDTLPSGLTLDLTSVAIDSVPTMAYTYTAPNITIDLGAISEPHTITFSTDVDSDIYLENGTTNYLNTATLTGDNVPGNATGTRTIGVSSSVVQKQGISYNRATAEITWRITINSNQVSIDNAVITDNIRIGQEYVTDSATINNGADITDFAYTPAAPEDPDKTGTLIYSFDTTIDQTYIIEFKTRVTDPDIYASNASIRYYNTATLDGDNIETSSNTGSRNVFSQVIAKTGIGYDYVTREIEWSITINANQMPLDNVTVTDEIPIGQEYVADSAAISGGMNPAGFSYTSADLGDPDKTGTLIYTFDASIDITYTITFKTVITDLSVFDTNGDKTFSNVASLTHDLVPGGVTTSGNQTVNNTVISKTGEYTTGNQYIDWTIIVNTNTIPLSSAVITDHFQQGLELDTISIQLFRLTVNPDGSTAAGEQIALGAGNVQYDFDTRTLDFHIPEPVSGAYMLTFRTIVTDKAQSPFTNQATFAGIGSSETGTSSPIVVAWAGSGSSGIGEVGSIDVYKVDSEDNNKFLEGCEFALIDRYGNVVQRKTTDGSGSALFNWLRFDVEYTVIETMAPEGYLLSDEEYTFQISSSAEDKDIEYHYANEQIKGGIRLYKYDLDMNPVADTGFTLYSADDVDFANPIATAYSSADGEVLFENVPYGDYAVKETDPATGYFGSDDVLTASVTEDGVIVEAGYIQNEAMLGSIRILKTGQNGETPLAGARLGLYRTGEDTPVAEGISGADGVVLFEEVVIGSYIIREIEAPAGYALSNREIAVSLTEDGQAADAGVLINTREDSPDTGDNIFWYVVLCIVSASGLVLIFIADKKIKKRGMRQSE